MFWSPLALHAGTFSSPLDLGSGNAWVGGAQSDLHTLFRGVAFWHLSNGGAYAPAGFWEIGRGGHAIKILVWLCVFRSATLLVSYDLSWHPWPRSGTSSWWYASSSLMLDDKVYSLVFSLPSSQISWLVLLYHFTNTFWDISNQQYEA